MAGNNPPAELELDLCGETFTIKNNFSLIRRVEETTGTSIIVLTQKLINLELSVTDLSKVLFAIVRGEDKAPKFDEIGECVVKVGARLYMNPVAEFLATTYIGHSDESRFKAKEDPQAANRAA